jgi:alpha-tubulin suppressor-like RCC1 family protein
VLISGEVLSNVVAIAAGGNESLALRSDGKVIGWGGIAVPAGLNSVVSIARGWNHAAAVMRDGTAVVFGSGNIKRMDGVTNIVSVAIGGGDYSSSLLLKSDGTVSIWGGPGGGHEEPAPVRLNNVTSIAAGGVNLALEKDEHVVEWGPATPVPASLSNIVAISAGLRHNLALKNDGTVLTWGFNPRHALDVPAQLSNVVAIAAGWDFSLAITTNQANLHY